MFAELDVSAFVVAEGGEADFERVALTRSQVARYNLPGAPPKSSSHDAVWREGEEAVQLEAMAPDDLAAEVQLAVESRLDLDLLAEAKSGEQGNREEFDAMMRRLRDGA